MADGFRCKHCGHQETYHIEGVYFDFLSRQEAEDFMKTFLPGYKNTEAMSWFYAIGV